MGRNPSTRFATCRAVVACAWLALSQTGLARGLEPEPGRIVEWTQRPGTPIRSVWLSNGVRVHHMRLPTENVKVTVQFVPDGAECDRAVCGQVLVASLVDHESQRPVDDAIAAMAKDHAIKVAAWTAGGGRVFLSASGAAGEAEPMMGVVRALLAEAVVGEDDVGAWRDHMREIVERENGAGRLAQTRLLAEVLGAERVWIPSPENVRQVDDDHASNCAERLLRERPLEASVVGAIARNDALDLAARYLGSLADRPRVEPVRFVPVARAVGQVELHGWAPLDDGRARVIVGFHGPGWDDLRGVRRVLVAATVIENRLLLSDLVAEGAKIEGTSVWAGRGLGDPGVVMLFATCEPSSVEPLVRRASAIIDDVTTQHPDEAEVREAIAMIRERLETDLGTTRFWGPRLAELDSLDLDPRELVSIIEAYDAVTAREVCDAVARHAVPASRFTLVVTPTQE